MIFDNLKNIERYKELDGIYKALCAIKNNEVKSEKISDNIKIISNKFVTESSENKLFENHKEHIDIHYCVEGTEKIELIFDLGKMDKSGEYQLEDDIEFFQNTKEDVAFELKKGDFLVIYPNQIHKPLCSIDKNLEVTKHIVKIKTKI